MITPTEVIFNALQFCNDQHNDKSLQVNFQSSNRSQNNLDRGVQVVKSHKQVLSDLNEFMVTEFRTFTNKCINLAVTVMPLVREFNQVCQVFADNVNQRYGYELEPQTLTTKEVEIWAKQFKVPVGHQSPTISYEW